MVIFGPDVLLKSGLRGGSGEKKNQLFKLDETKLLERKSIVKDNTRKFLREVLGWSFDIMINGVLRSNQAGIT